MSPTRRISPAGLLAFIGLAVAGCTGDVPSTAPAVKVPDAAVAAASAKPRPRTPFISDVQLSSINIPISPSDQYTPFTVTVTNPGPKDAQGISLEGVLEPTFNNQPPLATTFTAFCPTPNGTVPRGDCVMSEWIRPWALLSPGPGTFTLQLLQLQSDGTKKVLDTKTISVVFVV